MKFAQSMFTSTIEVLKSHAEATRALMQQWEQQTQKQQEAFQKMAPGAGETQWLESYMNFLRTGFSSYQQALDEAEKATQRGLKDFEKATEAFEKVAFQLPKTPGKRTSN